MKSVSALDICRATGGTLLSGSPECIFSGISTDTRTINPGDLFIPLVGENHDGHDYLRHAIEKGASGVISSRDQVPIPAGPAVAISVLDTLKALGDMAAWYRSALKCRIIAVTGSVGKTSTKDMTASVLSVGYKVLKSEGNHNNEIGLPMTLLKLDDSYDYAVVEMGMRGLGEISRLSCIARPDISIITNIGISHIERLGSRQNILKAKLEIIDGMPDDGIILLNGDDQLLPGIKGLVSQKTFYFGMTDNLDLRAYDIASLGEDGITFKVSLEEGEFTFIIRQPGIHNVYNGLAAIAAGISAGISPEGIIRGLKQYKSFAMRMNIIVKDPIKVIDDSYNASPQSMMAALDVLSEMSGASRRIAVLGDMLEIGDWTIEAHKETGRHAASRNIDWMLTVGESARNIAIGAFEAGFDTERILMVSERTSACRLLAGLVKPGDAVLVKGSRNMKLEEVVDYLLNNIAAGYNRQY